MYQGKVEVKFNHSRRIHRQIKDGAKDFNLAVAQDAEKWAHILVHKKTGALDATIRVLQDLATGDAYLVAGDENVKYAIRVELGSIHSAPHPFMYPAAIHARRDAHRHVRVIKIK